MSVVSDALRPHWLRGINEVSELPGGGFKEWVARERYVVNGLGGDGKSFSMYGVDRNEIVVSAAVDIERFALAAIETFSRAAARNELCGGYAWPLTRAYYSAFYAAHGICRLFGNSIVYLEREHSRAIGRGIAQLGTVGAAFRVYEKNYEFILGSVDASVQVTPLAKGPHEDLWRQFEKLLREIENRILIAGGVSSEMNEAVAELQALRSILNSDNSQGNWLSRVRNNICYRQAYGAWHPKGEGKHWGEVDALLKLFLIKPGAWHDLPDSKIIVRFAKGCVLVVSLFFDLLRDLEARNPKGTSFVSRRAGVLLESIRAVN